MKVNANTLRPNHVIEHEGRRYSILKYDLILPGKGNAFIALDMRDVSTGVKTNVRFRTQETVEKLTTDEKTCTILFMDGDLVTLMDSETYDQFTVEKNMAGEAAIFLTDGMEVLVNTVEGTPVGLTPPTSVTLLVTEADAVVKGQTASSSYKPAVTENGVRVMVPPHIRPAPRLSLTLQTARILSEQKTNFS